MYEPEPASTTARPMSTMNLEIIAMDFPPTPRAHNHLKYPSARILGFHKKQERDTKMTIEKILASTHVSP